MGFFSSLRRDMKGGTDAYKKLNKQRGEWVAQQMAAEGFKQEQQMFEAGGDSGGFYSQMVYTDPKAFQREKDLRTGWLATLDPATRAKAEKEFGLHSSDMDSVNKVGKGAALGIIGAAGIGAGLTAAGAIGPGSGLGSGWVEGPGLSGAGESAVLGSGWVEGPGLSGGTSSGGLLNAIKQAGGPLWSAVQANPGMASSIGGLLAGGLEAANKGSPAPQNFAPQPGLMMGALNQPKFNQSAGTLTPTAGVQRANSGMARFGATGGLFQPGAYSPQNFTWGQR